MARHPRLLAIAATLALAATSAGATAAHASSGAAWHSPHASPHSSSASPSGGKPTTPGSPSATPTPQPTTSTPSDPATAPSTPPGTANGKGPFNSEAITGSGNVALTFDDGPGPYTSQILDLLAQYHVKATFCVIGRQVQAYPEQIKRIVADGHTLCNHTWDHDEKLSTRTDGQIRAELQKTNDAIHAIVPDAKIQYFRNPGGNFGPNTVSIAKSMGMTSIYWSVDPRDWARPGTQAIINIVNGKTRPGSIVLSHDGGGDRSETVAAYRVLLPSLKSRLKLIALPVS